MGRFSSPMRLRVAINGLGRIGRTVLRMLAEKDVTAVELVAVNDLGPADMLAHLLRHDTVQGRFPMPVAVDGSHLVVGGRRLVTLRESDPARIDWASADIDVVIEATGRFRSRASAAAHLAGGARRVIITAPAPDADATVLFGINHHRFEPDGCAIISAGSCTAHAVAPLIVTLRDAFGWRDGWMTTIHPSTGDQQLVDGLHDDWRRARATGAGIIPTSSSAVGVIRGVLPGTSFSGMAYRVPTLLPAVVDLVASVGRVTTAREVADVFQAVADTLPSGVLAVNHEPLVAADYLGDTHSATVDAGCIKVSGGTQVHVTAWYDNEAGYARRLIDLLQFLATRRPTPRTAVADHVTAGRRAPAPSVAT